MNGALLRKRGRARLYEYDYDSCDVFGVVRHVQGFHVKAGGVLSIIPYPTPSHPTRDAALAEAERQMSQFGR